MSTENGGSSSNSGHAAEALAIRTTNKTNEWLQKEVRRLDGVNFKLERRIEVMEETHGLGPKLREHLLAAPQYRTGEDLTSFVDRCRVWSRERDRLLGTRPEPYKPTEVRVRELEKAEEEQRMAAVHQ